MDDMTCEETNESVKQARDAWIASGDVHTPAEQAAWDRYVVTVTTPGVDAWFREEGRSPFQAAVAWYRLMDAENSVNFATGTLNHPAVKALAVLRFELWNLLSEQTASDAERQTFLDRARSYVRGEDR